LRSARSIGASPPAVGDYIRRAQVAGLSWPLPEGMDERAVQAKPAPVRDAPDGRGLARRPGVSYPAPMRAMPFPADSSAGARAGAR